MNCMDQANINVDQNLRGDAFSINSVNLLQLKKPMPPTPKYHWATGIGTPNPFRLFQHLQKLGQWLSRA